MALPLCFLLAGLSLTEAFLPTALSPSRLAPRVQSTSRALEEETLTKDLLAATSAFKRYGVDSADKSHWPAFAAACARLEARAPYIMEDDVSVPQELVGDWELIGTTSSALFAAKGITGLGKVPFTKPHKHGLFFRYAPALPPATSSSSSSDGGGSPECSEGAMPGPGWGGAARVAEVLEVFGKPTAKNELRGEYRWASPFRLEQVQHAHASTLARAWVFALLL